MKKNYLLIVFLMILYSAKGQVCGTPIPQFDQTQHHQQIKI